MECYSVRVNNKQYKVEFENNRDASSIQEVYRRLKRVGTAIARINGNNTHSGNLSMRDPDDSDTFYITSSGSQCGDLILQDIVPIRFSGVSWGDARVSTESTIHRQVLSLPGAHSVVHAHYPNSTFISFDTKEKQLFLQFLGTDSKESIYSPLRHSQGRANIKLPCA